MIFAIDALLVMLLGAAWLLHCVTGYDTLWCAGALVLVFNIIALFSERIISRVGDMFYFFRFVGERIYTSFFKEQQ